MDFKSLQGRHHVLIISLYSLTFSLGTRAERVLSYSHGRPCPLDMDINMVTSSISSERLEIKRCYH